MDRLYERLTPAERFRIAVAAFGRGDLAEIDRLNGTTPNRTVKIQAPACFDRRQRITWQALYVTVQVRNQQAAALATYAALVLHTLPADDLDRGDADEDAAKFENLCELCAERVSRLKALSAAWKSFCASLGVSASDIHKMIGLPFLGSRGVLDVIQETVGEISPDEDYQHECLDHVAGFWDSMIRDRHSQ